MLDPSLSAPADQPGARLRWRDLSLVARLIAVFGGFAVVAFAIGALSFLGKSASRKPDAARIATRSAPAARPEPRPSELLAGAIALTELGDRDLLLRRTDGLLGQLAASFATTRDDVASKVTDTCLVLERLGISQSPLDLMEDLNGMSMSGGDTDTLTFVLRRYRELRNQSRGSFRAVWDACDEAMASNRNLRSQRG